MNILFLVCVFFFLQMGLGLAQAEIPTTDPYVRPSSTSRMEDTLQKLRENTQEAVVENYKLSEKNRRFQERAVELERESVQIENAKAQLLEKRDAVLDELKKEVSQTQVMQNEIDKLNSNISSVDQQELSIKDRIISKDVEQEALKRKVDSLREEIHNLQEKVSSSKVNPGMKYSQEYLQQKSALDDQLAGLDRVNAQSESVRAQAVRLSDELRSARAKTEALREKQKGCEAEIVDLKDQQQRLENSYAQRREGNKREVAQLNVQIAELTTRRSALMDAGKRAQLLQKELALSIQDELLQGNVSMLMTERDVLSKQFDLLSQQVNLGTKNSAQESTDEVKKLEERVSALNKEQNDLLLLVEQKGRESKQAQSTLTDLQQFVPRIKKAFQVLKERNDRKLGIEENRLSRDETARNKARMSMLEKSAAMKSQLSAVRNELDNLTLEGNLLAQQEQAQSVHGNYDLEKLKAELAKFELNKEYLAGTLKAVRAKLKDSDSVVLPWSSNEELDLKNHVTSLKQENKHLQFELLSVSMEQDKGDGSSKMQGGNEKNL